MKEKGGNFMFNEFKKTFAQASGVVAGYVVAGAVVLFVTGEAENFIKSVVRKEVEKEKTETN